MKASKEALRQALEQIANEENAKFEGLAGGWHYEAIVRDWQNYGKDRTYFSIYETRSCSKHFKKFEYGYLDNQTGNYTRGQRQLVLD